MAKRLTGTSPPDAETHPFTHHEILRLIRPFVRGGLQVDLARTDRIRRCLAFKAIEHPSANTQLDGMRATIQLENPRSELYRLTRTLTLPNGLEASLRAEGPDIAGLLALISSVSPHKQFRTESGAVIAFSYGLDPSTDSLLSMQPVFARAEAHVEGLNMVLNDSTVNAFPAKVDFASAPGYTFELPEDLLAVLGRDWGVLRRRRKGWSSSLRLRGSSFDRSRRIEAKVERLVAHLSATFSQPPRHFHESLRRARWGVMFRRAVPLMIFAVLIAGGVGLSFVSIPENSFIRLLTVAVPAVLLFSAFTMHDRPPLELPSLPRRPKPAAWRQPPAAVQPP
jgi:hypothetical protein